MSDTSPMTDDEIDLFALWETLRDQWLTWVGAALVGLLMALGVSQLMTPQYEATLLVRVGQVGKWGKWGKPAHPWSSLCLW